MRNKSTKKGFTLIELLVGIAVVGILSTALLAVLNPLEQIKKGRDAQRKQDLAQIQRPLELYYNDKGIYPPDSPPFPFGREWIEEGSQYMAKVPQDPSPAQTYAYRTEEGGYRLFAKLERCSDNQVIAGIDCNDPTVTYNYSVTSPNLSVVPFGGGGPTPTLSLPSSTPIPTVSVPTPTTSVPTPTSTVSTPTPTPISSAKRVFVTSTKYSGNLGGLSGADDKCRQRAAAVPLVGTWIAWLSDSTTDAKNRITLTTGDYVRRDGVVIANGWRDLLDGSIDVPLNRDEFNNQITTTPTVWTATNSDGTKYLNLGNPPCQDWTSTSGEFGLTGNPTTTANWTNSGSVGTCSSSVSLQKRLYCFEQ